MATPMLAGDGSYSFEIVGEGRRQAELESICGGTRPGIEQECLALLFSESAEEGESPDVRVEINGRHVGNLPRSDAAGYAEAIGRLGWEGDALACRALISSDERNYMTVELDLVWPLRMVAEAASEWPAREPLAPYAPKRRRRRSILGALTLMVLLVAGVGAALWYLPTPEQPAGMVGPVEEAAPPDSADDPATAPPEQEPAAEQEAIEPAAPPAAEQEGEAESGAEQAAAPANASCGPYPDAATATRAWEIVQNSGVVTSMSPTGDISVNDAIWDTLPQEDKVAFAMAGFCQSVKANGSGAMLIVGSESGELKGSIIDGAWHDPVQQ
jgi:hypothetical protein